MLRALFRGAMLAALLAPPTLCWAVLLLSGSYCVLLWRYGSVGFIVYIKILFYNWKQLFYSHGHECTIVLLTRTPVYDCFTHTDTSVRLLYSHGHRCTIALLTRTLVYGCFTHTNTSVRLFYSHGYQCTIVLLTRTPVYDCFTHTDTGVRLLYSHGHKCTIILLTRTPVYDCWLACSVLLPLVSHYGWLGYRVKYCFDLSKDTIRHEMWYTVNGQHKPTYNIGFSRQKRFSYLSKKDDDDNGQCIITKLTYPRLDLLANGRRGCVTWFTAVTLYIGSIPRTRSIKV